MSTEMATRLAGSRSASVWTRRSSAASERAADVNTAEMPVASIGCRTVARLHLARVNGHRCVTEIMDVAGYDADAERFVLSSRMQSDGSDAAETRAGSRDVLRGRNQLSIPTDE